MKELNIEDDGVESDRGLYRRYEVTWEHFGEKKIDWVYAVDELECFSLALTALKADPSTKLVQSHADYDERAVQ